MSSKHIILKIVCLVGLFLSEITHANCSREDVVFYLEKGFDNNQITVICGDDNVVSKPTQSVTTTSSNFATFTTKKRKELGNFEILKSSINASSIQFDSDKFYFDRRECIEYDNLSSQEMPKKFCGNFRSVIYYADLKVLDSKQYSLDRFFKPTVEVMGDVKKEVLDTKKFNSLLTNFEKSLLLKIIRDKTLKIPIRERALVSQVKTNLKKLAK